MKKTKKAAKKNVLKKKPAVAKPAKKGPAPKKPAAPAQQVTPPVGEAPPKTLKLAKADALKYKKLLLDLRDHLIDGVNSLASENLKRSSRDVSGELSGYSLHMADAGTDNFDREFALSLVSNEQEALYEIEEALKRLETGTYGLCEMCEKPIRRERLDAVPFARLCVACQSIAEKTHRRPAAPVASFSEGVEDEIEEKEDSEE
jgi:RNA polymerase-binding transcription factor DksA